MGRVTFPTYKLKSNLLLLTNVKYNSTKLIESLYTTKKNYPDQILSWSQNIPFPTTPFLEMIVVGD